MRSLRPAPDFLTFDIEEWYMANYGGDVFSTHPSSASRIDWETDRLLGICDEHQIRATCFFVGSLAEERPDIVRKFHQQGHEIATHGYAHGLVYRMTPEAFRADLSRSIRILEDCTGDSIRGFRAPSWSVRADTLLWFYGILEEEGIGYSSSVYPAQTYLYGIRGFPERIHRPEVGGRKTAVYEVPQVLTTLLGKKIGFSGGFFLRIFPTWFIKATLSRKNEQGKSAFIYVHPREIDPEAHRLPLAWIDRFVHYYNVAGAEGKLRKILACDKFEFLTIGEYVRGLEAGE
jgi:polysaccharide deacetylase family protein (PEP-CTERM system associated)